jgi:alpha-galactosidase
MQHPTRRKLTLTFLFTAIIALTLQAEQPTPQETSAAEHWAQTNLFPDGIKQSFSFVLGGKFSDALLPDWKRTDAVRDLDAQRRERTRTWTDDKSGLQVRLMANEYAGFPVVEWTLWLKNTGSADTAIVEGIQGLDWKPPLEMDQKLRLHGIRGDTCAAESFKPWTRELKPGARHVFSPPVKGDYASGKSSDGPNGWPYWNLQTPEGGMILAVGWPGQWEAAFDRGANGALHLKAGQQLTHLVLKPGEEIRTPSITLLLWQGNDVVRAQNLWRSWYLAHVLPRIGGEPQPPTTQIQVGASLATWGGVQAFLNAGIKPDILWRDAGSDSKSTWYPSAGPRKTEWLNTGTWEPDPARYPQGFRPFSNKARANGMQFLLWFEPERVGDPGSWLGKNHPEWLLPGNSAGDVLNLGNPNALKWVIDHIDSMVKSEGLDWYREDLNGDGYATAWRKADAPDRQGITENLHVQGHLAFWDELRRRNPNLRLDSCASGGRRNDLETMRRSVPLLRSDWSVMDFKDTPLQREGNQSQTYGLSSWLPWQGAGVHFTDNYSVRSYYLTGFGMIVPGWTKTPESVAGVHKGYAECRRIAPLMLGDYFPLTPHSLDTTSWIAWQFQRNDLGDGVVQAFRRPDAPNDTLTVKLRGLDALRRYEIENLDGGKETRTGEELMRGYEITLREKPAAAVLVLKAL